MRRGLGGAICRRGSAIFRRGPSRLSCSCKTAARARSTCSIPSPSSKNAAANGIRRKVESFQPGSQANLLMGSAFRFRQHGECGMELSELLAAHRLGGRRHLPRAVDGGRQQQPSAGAAAASTRGRSSPAGRRFGAWVSYALGTLNQNLPCVRGAPRSRRLQQRRHDAVGKRLAAGPLRRNGDSIPRGGRPQPASLETDAEPGRAEQPLALGRTQRGSPQALSGRHGARGPHQELRAGRPHAASRRAAAGSFARDAGHAAALRPRQSDDGQLRHALPDGPPAGRSGRARISR